MSESCCPLCGADFKSDDLILLPSSHLIVRNGVKVYLTIREWEMFDKLYQAKGRVVSRGAMLDWIYQQSPEEAQPKIIDVFASRLRRKVEPLGLDIVSHFAVGHSLSFKGTSRVVEDLVTA